MAYTLPQKVRRLTPYTPVTEGLRIRCDANESSLPPPAGVMADIRRRLEAVALNRYPDPCAAECCRLASRRYGVEASQIVAGNGSDELISLIENCLLERGAKVASFELDFSMYAFYAALAELTHIPLRQRDDLTIDVDGVLRILRAQGADMLLFSNPCNPTGQLLPSGEVERLAAGTDALVVVDEAYMEFGRDSAARLIPRFPNLLVLRTCSKAVALAGARVGFALGQRPLIDAIKSAKSPYNVSSLSQAVAAAVLSAGDFIDGNADALLRSAQWLQEGLAGLSGRHPALRRVFPTQANFVFVQTPQAEAIDAGLRARGIAVRRFPGALRISAGLPEEDAALLRALEEILREVEA